MSISLMAIPSTMSSHKLGDGGVADVWLCGDMEASEVQIPILIILLAQASEEDCPELLVGTPKASS